LDIQDTCPHFPEETVIWYKLCSKCF